MNNSLLLLSWPSCKIFLRITFHNWVNVCYLFNLHEIILSISYLIIILHVLISPIVRSLATSESSASSAWRATTTTIFIPLPIISTKVLFLKWRLISLEMLWLLLQLRMLLLVWLLLQLLLLFMLLWQLLFLFLWCLLSRHFHVHFSAHKLDSVLGIDRFLSIFRFFKL